MLVSTMGHHCIASLVKLICLSVGQILVELLAFLVGFGFGEHRWAGSGQLRLGPSEETALSWLRCCPSYNSSTLVCLVGWFTFCVIKSNVSGRCSGGRGHFVLQLIWDLFCKLVEQLTIHFLSNSAAFINDETYNHHCIDRNVTRVNNLFVQYRSSFGKMG